MGSNHDFIFLFFSLLVLTSLEISDGIGKGELNHGRLKNNDQHSQWKNNDQHGHPNNNHQHGHEMTRTVNCPQLETISRDVTWRRVAANPILPAKLLRMQFHDCFVRGCDGSILLDPRDGIAVEKEAIPNQSLIGYDVIDEIKAKLEEECPGEVSCADILALAARDAVSYQFKRPIWPVFIGRKDGKISLASEANRDLPSPAANFTTLKQQFESHGLNVLDLVALSGAHTIGIGHCVIIANRLFNFTGIGDTDPSIDPNYANFLKQKCSPPNPNTTVEMDPGSSFSFDSQYFVALNQKKGLLESDAALLTDPEASRLSSIFQNQNVFLARFAQSMVKMSSIGGQEGEIRKNCRIVN